MTTAGGETVPLFREREILHLVDVKRLLERTYDAGWAALGYLVAFVAAVLLLRPRDGGRAWSPG